MPGEVSYCAAEQLTHPGTGFKARKAASTIRAIPDPARFTLCACSLAHPSGDDPVAQSSQTFVPAEHLQHVENAGRRAASGERRA